MAILSQQYDWAEKRLEPVKKRALGAAEESVETWPRIVFGVMCGLAVIAFGFFWGLGPDAPGWWPHRRAVVALRRVGPRDDADRVRPDRDRADHLQLPSVPVELRPSYPGDTPDLAAYPRRHEALARYDDGGTTPALTVTRA